MCIFRIGIVLCALILWLRVVDGPAYAQQRVIAEGEWSKPVADTRGYAVRGRLVISEKPRDDDRREVLVMIELQDARGSVGGSTRIFCDLGKTNFRPENKNGLVCQLQDKNKQPVPSTTFAFGGGTPASEWVTLPSDSTIRLRSTPFGIHRAKSIAISPHLGQLWEIADSDRNEYFLSGTFTSDPEEGRKSVEDPHIWRGTIDLPAVRIVNQATAP